MSKIWILSFYLHKNLHNNLIKYSGAVLRKKQTNISSDRLDQSLKWR